MEAYQFDSVLFPVNWAHFFNNGFGKRIMEKAIEKDVYRLSLKAMAKTNWEEDAQKTYPKAWYEPIQEKELAQLAMRYSLSQPISAAIPSGDITHFRWALEVGSNFSRVTDDEVEFLKKQRRRLQPIFE